MLKNKLNVMLISWALLSLKSRHTCGTIPIVVRNPPTNPISSFQSKCFLPFLYYITMATFWEQKLCNRKTMRSCLELQMNDTNLDKWNRALHWFARHRGFTRRKFCCPLFEPLRFMFLSFHSHSTRRYQNRIVQIRNTKPRAGFRSKLLSSG